MTANTPTILACLKLNVERAANNPKLLSFAQERLAAYEERIRRARLRFDNPMERFAQKMNTPAHRPSGSGDADGSPL